jgi:inner membrane protease ATP23
MASTTLSIKRFYSLSNFWKKNRTLTWTFVHITSKIALCQNHLKTPSRAKETILHELVHLYDSRQPGFSLSNCCHVACTEIRAAKLSGDCSLSNELGRGLVFFSPASWFHSLESCVRRRAELALSAIPECRSRARESVDQVFSPCFSDDSPLNT